MQDDKDIELEEFEDDEFLDDEALDAEFDLEDLDDLGDIEDLEDDFSDADLDVDLSDSEKNNGSVNKVLIYGLVGVFVLGALFVGFQSIVPLFSGSSQNNSEAAQVASADSGTGLVQDAPPMPVPINNVAEEDAAVQDTLPEPVVLSPALTPLPSLDSPADLDLPPLRGDVEQDIAVEPSPPPPLELAEAEDVLPEMAPVLPGIVEAEPIPAAEDVVTPLVTEPEPDIIQPRESVMREDDTADMAVSAVDAQNSAVLDAMVEEKVTALTNRLNGHDEVLARIMDSLERIETELEAQKNSIEAVDKIAKKIASTPAPVAKKAVRKKVKAPAKKPVLYDKTPKNTSRSSKTSSAKATSWILKSAQPGRAVVAERGTNYLRGVEVGSSLSGLGKITSISNESGRWIVQGTKGRVVQ